MGLGEMGLGEMGQNPPDGRPTAISGRARLPSVRPWAALPFRISQ